MSLLFSLSMLSFSCTLKGLFPLFYRPPYPPPSQTVISKHGNLEKGQIYSISRIHMT